jgi:hypothetical protein
LKVWAGDPPYECIKDQVKAAWTSAGWAASDLMDKTTVVDCFRTGPRRLNPELVVAIVQALHPDIGYVTQWRQALRVVGGESRASPVVKHTAVMKRAARRGLVACSWCHTFQ